MTLHQGQGHGASLCGPKTTILVVEVNVTVLGCKVVDMEAHLLSQVWMT